MSLFAHLRHRRRQRVIRGQALVLWSICQLRRASGIEIQQVTGLSFGAVYAALDRLESELYVDAEWGPPVSPGGPRRRWYRPASDAHDRVDELLAQLTA